MNLLRPVSLALLVACSSLLGANSLFAQSETKGVNRGLSAAAHGMGPRAMARSSEQISKAQSHTPSSATELGRKLNGIHRSKVVFTPPRLGVDGHGSIAPNPDRIYDKRLQQADHLRDLSAKNGNESLLETADRMEANATRNYEHQTGVSPPSPEADVEGDSAGNASSAIARHETAPRTKRGFWIRAR